MLADVRGALAVVPLLFALACERAPAPRVTLRDAAAPTAVVAPTAVAAPASAPSPAAASGPAVDFRLRSAKAPPPHRCAVRADADLGAGERTLAGFAKEEALLLVAEAEGRTLALYGGSLGEPLARRATHALSSAVLRLAWACGEAGCELGVVDAKARLLGFRVERDRVRELGVLASGVDRRFAPAVTELGERAMYAFTSTIDEAMHTSLVVRSGSKLAAPRDLTPAGHGAAAPTFVRGAKVPTLIAIDARAGLSPLLEFDLGDPAQPGTAKVGTPVSAPYAPPLLAAVAWPSGDVEVFYTVVGRAAMTAIGRVPLRRPLEPAPLAPSRGYGELHFSVALAGARALIAVEQPSAPAATAKRTLLLKLTDGANTYDALTLDEGGEAARPSLAVHSDGSFLLGYTSAGHVHAALLSCSP